MKQQGDGSNNVQIGNAGIGNTFKIGHNNPTFAHTQMTVDEDSIRRHKNKHIVQKEAQKGVAKILGFIILGILGYFSDTIGLANHFGFPAFWSIPAGLFIGALVAAPQIFSISLMQRLMNSKGQPTFVGNCEIVDETEDGTIITFHRTARCIYPNRTGKVFLAPATNHIKQAYGRKFVGICSVADWEHFYFVDKIWNTYPRELDTPSASSRKQ